MIGNLFVVSSPPQTSSSHVPTQQIPLGFCFQEPIVLASTVNIAISTEYNPCEYGVQKNQASRSWASHLLACSFIPQVCCAYLVQTLIMTSQFMHNLTNPSVPCHALGARDRRLCPLAYCAHAEELTSV